MASSFYSNAQHVDFESVLGMDDHGMVSMFEALVDSGLRGFLGCPAVVYEDALVDFFENASVRSGVIISTVGGQLVEISEALFAESFELPVDGFGDLSEIPKDAIFDARSIVSVSGEPINLSGRKNQMKMPFRLLCDIMAKAISVKAGSFNAITVENFSLITAVVCGVKMNWAKYLFGILMKMVTAGSKKAKGFAIQLSLLLATFPSLELGESSEFPSSKVLTKKTVHHFVSVNNRDGAEEVSGAVKQKAVSKKRPAADVGAAVPKKKRTFKKKSIYSISSLEMVAVAEEAVPIQQVAEPLDVEEPRCSSADAVDLIIQQVLDETRAADAPADTAEPAVTEEKHWFDLPYDDLVLSWGETESPQEAIQRKFYILLKYRKVLVWKFLYAWRVNFAPGQGSSAIDIRVIELLSDLYLSLLEELAKEARSLNLTWTKPCCSKIFEGSPRDRGAVIARNNTNTRSSCWIRTMIMVDGVWTVEPCADKWVKIPRKVFSTEVPRQRQYDDTLPTMSIFFRMMRKRWADVCLEVVEFYISEFLSSIALDRTILRSVQRFQDSSSVAPSVQLSLEQHQSSSSSDSSSPLHFDQTDIDATASSRPTISPDLSAVFADFQAALSEQIFASQSDISSRMHKLEQSVCDSLRDQADIFRNLSQGARQEVRTLDDVHTIRFNEFRKNVLTQNASIFQGLADVRQVVEAVNAKVDIMASRVNAIQKDAEATKEALSHQLLEFQSSAQENHNVIHAQLIEVLDTDIDATASSRPTISPDLSAVFADFQAALSEQIFVSQSDISSRMHKLEQSVCDSLRDQADIFRSLSQGARQEFRTLHDVHTIRFNEFRKNVLTQNASIFQGLADVRQVVDAVNAKVDIMDKRLTDIQKDAEASKKDLSHQLLEFQSSAQENHNVIHAQLSELVDYIHRGSADKNGESGSRGLQKPANTQKEGSAVTPTFEQRVQMAQRRIVQTVLDADANRAMSQDAAERDRERRRKEAKSLKRRRRD
ncbi:hypothetical protein F511_22374 [Dorcoceras hygrometricum]|uniref:Dystroglycan-like n=1 Tax=Dorcoceras hygrometricum TaxID=472368 RepID=A0A2Z7AEG9_9LAMI|nr:hypothetical protein F511_22374 [Dorcoceras hygrometricum]